AADLELAEDVFHRAHLGDGVDGLAFERDGWNELTMCDPQVVLRLGGRLVRVNGVGQANSQLAWLDPRLSCDHENLALPCVRSLLWGALVSPLIPKRGVVPTPLTAW